MPAEGSLVFVSLGDSDGEGSSGSAGELSSLVNASGYWSVNFGNARTRDLAGYFGYSASGDVVSIEAAGGADGDASVAVDTADDAPAASLTLVVVAPTATATVTETPTPGGSTATPVDTATPTALPTGSSLVDGLVSYWKLDEVSGTRIDSHAMNDLTDNNGVGSASGKINGSADFIAASVLS